MTLFFLQVTVTPSTYLESLSLMPSSSGIHVLPIRLKHQYWIGTGEEDAPLSVIIQSTETGQKVTVPVRIRVIGDRDSVMRCAARSEFTFSDALTSPVSYLRHALTSISDWLWPLVTVTASFLCLYFGYVFIVHAGLRAVKQSLSSMLNMAVTQPSTPALSNSSVAGHPSPSLTPPRGRYYPIGSPQIYGVTSMRQRST